MEKPRILAGLLCACTLSALGLLSCSTGSVPSSTQWTITGTAQFTGAAATAIKLAAFYYLAGTGTPASIAPISNVVNVGTVAGTPATFSLSIDTGSLNPAAGDSIFIRMWDDTNADNQMDAGEPQVGCTPMAGDAVFTATTVCLFVFAVPYWYLGNLPIQSVAKTGASITSLTSLL
jgi:hypothetical protein